MASYQPIGTGYQPIGTGYNRAKGEYGLTGALEQIKSNNLFKGEFNNRTATQVRAGKAGYSGDTSRLQLSQEAPRTWGTSAGSSSLTSGQQQGMSNPAQYLSGNQQSTAAQLLGQPLDSYDAMRDTNNNGIIDPWEM